MHDLIQYGLQAVTILGGVAALRQHVVQQAAWRQNIDDRVGVLEKRFDEHTHTLYQKIDTLSGETRSEYRSMMECTSGIRESIARIEGRLLGVTTPSAE